MALKATKSQFEEEVLNLVKKNHQILSRYEMVTALGTGAYGVVVNCFDHKRDRNVAIKLTRNEPYFHAKYLYEVAVLTTLRSKLGKQNVVVSIYSSFIYRGFPCIVMELLGDDLATFMRKNDIANMDDVNFITSSLLYCLKTLHDLNFTHADLKPNNVAFIRNGSLLVKLIDAGSCKHGPQETNEDRQCPLYRAPEIIFRQGHDTSLDIWSFGCILMELVTGKKLFQGTNNQEQVRSITEVLGIPPRRLIKKSKEAQTYFTEDRRIKYCTSMNSKMSAPVGKPYTRDLRKLLRGRNSPELYHFIRGCLTWDPQERMSACEALSHSWIKHKDAVEPKFSFNVLDHAKRPKSEP